jgi:hypothetical protein
VLSSDRAAQNQVEAATAGSRARALADAALALFHSKQLAPFHLTALGLAAGKFEKHPMAAMQPSVQEFFGPRDGLGLGALKRSMSPEQRHPPLPLGGGGGGGSKRRLTSATGSGGARSRELPSGAAPRRPADGSDWAAQYDRWRQDALAAAAESDPAAAAAAAAAAATVADSASSPPKLSVLLSQILSGDRSAEAVADQLQRRAARLGLQYLAHA